MLNNGLGKIDIIANINWIAINIRGAYTPNSNSSSLILVGLRSNCLYIQISRIREELQLLLQQIYKK